ncbi:beta-glucosidase [Saitoella complicata NRRL Y-17804]|uniref:beta-glucosidase n=1 Tax=Saitoella complicata (strain BCRC 22490 / CBS 7301 / JCM 7358 / NBRC 10748 / NRRL Y-17804) TaxID=698492 RepID=UPI000867FADE|nr:beta-glucosidase [Saitoella complicata NRRL Y-17804]ODQ52709.1 beta-glucosidase [Saitoella complicata NRRL Y-17804]
MLLYATVALTLFAGAKAQVDGIYYPQPLEGYYPSPRGSGLGNWSAAYDAARATLGDMTLLEKVNLTTGIGWQQGPCVGNTGSVPRLCIPSLCLQDSPLGVRDTDYNSVFPAGITVAQTFNRTAMYLRGVAMGKEFRGKGVNVQLGPVAGPLGRDPEGGRNWEGFSADPYVCGAAMYETITGIQSQGVIACAKHYIAYAQEHFRQVGEAEGYGYDITDSYSSNLGQRTLHELYAWPFQDAVRANVGSVMTSYNQINNSYAAQNAYLINGVLKDEFGFQGFVVSDWWGQHSGVESALAGLDMSMPGDTAAGSDGAWFGPNLTEAVVNGSVPLWRVDDMATRILAAWYYMGQDNDYPEVNFNSWTLRTEGYEDFAAQEDFGVVNEHVNVMDEHRKLIRDIAAEANVLLKNVKANGKPALPLEDGIPFIAIFGSDAGPAEVGPNGCPDRGCDNGTLAVGWGSGTANFPYLVDPLEAIQERASAAGSEVMWVLDNYAYDEAITLADQAADAPSGVCLVFVNADSGEGYIDVDGNEGDRNNLTLWHDGDTLIKTVAEHCYNTVVVIHSVGPVILEEWIEHPNVTGVIWAGLPGQESGHAITDVLFGDVNPSGVLPFTIAKCRDDYPAHVLYQPNFSVPQINFTEGTLIDYRWFLCNNITPRYSFGYGLSYTEFRYGNITVETVGDLGDYAPRPATPSLSFLNDTVPPVSDLCFPTSISSVSGYIYPYISCPTSVPSSGAHPHKPKADADSTMAETTCSKTSTAPRPSLSGEGQNEFNSFPYSRNGGGVGGNPSLYDVIFKISFEVENVGCSKGATVPQIFLRYAQDDMQGDSKCEDCAQLTVADYERLFMSDQVEIVPVGDVPRNVTWSETDLRGFDKVELYPGEKTTVTFELTRRDVTRWSFSSTLGYPYALGEGLYKRDGRTENAINCIRR